MKQSLEQEYYFLPDGRLVFTEHYHRMRGYCCASGCRHCPYDYVNVPKPKRSLLIQKKKKNETNQ
ncbi:MAG: DUF5522 domain-containing protein [Phycisphaerales bacterium]|nr:DUF5522 domain-containing protein [Phycisphaerales bacterium]